MIELEAGDARCVVVPELGAAIASLTVGDRPVLRSTDAKPADEAFELACNLMVPFSNRINGGFTVDGTFYRLDPNRTDQPYAIHGDGFQKAWAVERQSGTEASLTLEGAYGPLIYSARVDYQLTAGALTSVLTLTSRADDMLPFGGGFHPWFPRSDHTRLKAKLTGFWPAGADKLPTSAVEQPVPIDFDFSEPTRLPTGALDNGFSGWDGSAHIDQGEDAVSVSITSSTLDHAIIYAPSPEAGFFCFEPVSHPINAHNLPGMPGLKLLAPGERLRMDMVLEWQGMRR
ncbi:MAG: aldose 1-epimerase [Pseudomonadota bacterium]